MNTSYIAILNEKELMWANSVEELAPLPNLDYYIKREFHSEQTIATGTSIQLIKYTPIERNGNSKTIEIGDFSILDIRPEKNRSIRVGDQFLYYTTSDIIVYEKTKKITHIYHSIYFGKNYLIDEFLRLIKTLEKTQDWELFLSISKIPLLEATNQTLTKQIATLKEKIKDLKKQ